MPDRPLNLVPASLRDYRELARRRLPRLLFDYIDGGANEERTMRRNEQDLARIVLRQRVLRDVGSLDTRVTVLGQSLGMPVALAPVGLAGMFRRRGECLAARAAEAADIPFCESTVSICSLEEVCASRRTAPWFQLYVMRDRGFTASLLEKADSLGVRTLLLTVDLAAVGSRHRETRNGLTAGRGARIALARLRDIVSHPAWAVDVGLRGKPHTFGNLASQVPGANTPAAFREWVDSQWDPTVSWRDLDWVRRHFKGQVLLKGVLDPDDAKEALRSGVDGIVVSNHGGRQLDDVPSSVQALAEIREAVPSGLTLLVDGGIRSGLDVFKALASGADATLIGRPWVYAMTAGGEAAVTEMLGMLRKELEVAMALAGVTRVAQIDRGCVAEVAARAVQDFD